MLCGLGGGCCAPEALSGSQICPGCQSRVWSCPELAAAPRPAVWVPAGKPMAVPGRCEKVTPLCAVLDPCRGSKVRRLLFKYQQQCGRNGLAACDRVRGDGQHATVLLLTHHSHMSGMAQSPKFPMIQAVRVGQLVELLAPSASQHVSMLQTDVSWNADHMKDAQLGRRLPATTCSQLGRNRYLHEAGAIQSWLRGPQRPALMVQGSFGPGKVPGSRPGIAGVLGVRIAGG